jgi:hypothetical protein
LLWAYFTFQRGARLITGPTQFRPITVVRDGPDGSRPAVLLDRSVAGSQTV